MWKLPATSIAAVAAAICSVPTAAEAQYYSYSRSSSIGYTTSLVSGDQKAKGPIRRGYINKYGQVIATDHHGADQNAGDDARRSDRPAARAPAQTSAN